jgi:hypothetical protein
MINETVKVQGNLTSWVWAHGECLANEGINMNWVFMVYIHQTKVHNQCFCDSWNVLSLWIFWIVVPCALRVKNVFLGFYLQGHTVLQPRRPILIFTAFRTTDMTCNVLFVWHPWVRVRQNKFCAYKYICVCKVWNLFYVVHTLQV